MKKQVLMLTDEIFDVVRHSRKHIMDQLLKNDGYVFNLEYPGPGGNSLLEVIKNCFK